MRIQAFALSLVGTLLCCCFVATSYAQVLAFPEAEGFGRYATGARTNLASASVYHVTNLNDSGPGSFRDAVSQSNRFVVFDVGGIANIESVVPVASNITIAGQTAPGGFTLYNDRISFTSSNNLISRHFAVRKGDPGVRTDAASIARGTNMIFDHMSITWGVDGTFDINPDSGYVIDDITIQDSIIAQGLDRVGHSTGGLMQPGEGGSVSVIRSLWADNVTRNPKVRFENEFINNVVYGWETAAYIMGDTTGADSFANVEGNYFIEGPVDGSFPFSGGTSNFHIYASDNWIDSNRNGALDGTLNRSYPGAVSERNRHDFPTTTMISAQDAVTHVKENAGPNIVRDAVDTRLMEEVASYGTLGGVIERETDLFPGFGTDPIYLNPRAGLTDNDRDGIADNWESDRGLNPANATDWKGLNPAGYTRLEEYLNELGSDGVTVSSTGGNWTTPGTWTAAAPTLADEATATGSLNLSSGHGFARRLHVEGDLTVSGGTVDVFDTATVTGGLTVSDGVVTLGRTLVSAPGGTGFLMLDEGATLQTGTIASGGGAPLFQFNGGTLRTTGTPDIQLTTILGANGGTIDTNGHSGTYSGALIGLGGITKQGQGSLTISNDNSYSGPTIIEQGELIISSGGLGNTSGVELATGTTLDVSAETFGLSLGSGQSLSGSGTVVGDVVASSGSVIRPQGSKGSANDRPIAIQAEDLILGSDWAVFDNSLHGTSVGGSYDGADLSGGGIILVANDRSGVPPVASGIAGTTITIPETKTWYLFAKVAEPSVSPLPGDPATQPRGNNSFFTSGTSNTLQATTSNYEEVQSNANSSADYDASTWNLVSTGISPLSGVLTPENAGIDYFLSSGEQFFSIYGRELGTILDAFVLSDTNLTAEELDAALLGGPNFVLTIDGNFTAGNSLFDVELAGGDTLNMLAVTGTATLGGTVAISLAEGFEPLPSDEFDILEAGVLVEEFFNAADGDRIPTSDLGGSFVIDYDYGQGKVSLSSYVAALPGDFNFDLTVDEADLEWLQSHYGTNASAVDFLVWQRNYGATAQVAASIAVPEPSSCVLLGLAAGALLGLRRR